MAIDFDKLGDDSHLLDVLIQVEDVLDSMDTYIFKNWIDGEVVEGPIIRRHWVSMSLLYPYNKMPDPKAALRLLKHGVIVEYSRVERAAEMTRKGNTGMPEAKSSGEKDWFVKITCPRRLIDEINAKNIENYEDDVDVSHIEDAQDSGIDNETAYYEDENGEDNSNSNPMDGPDGFPQ